MTMVGNKKNFDYGKTSPDPEEIREKFSIEDDSDTLEPFVDENEYRKINADDPDDVAQWAEQFQLSIVDLRAAIVLNGNSVKEIKKYLSV